MKTRRPLALLSISTLVLATSSAAAQTQVSGNQSGVWTLAGSPYQLIGDVLVPSGGQLTIEAGVEVVGFGPFRLDVRPSGQLTAVGTAQAPILFSADDTVSGWRGVRLEQASDLSHLQHCVLEYAMGSGAYPGVRGGGLSVVGCSPTIEDCELRFNSSHNANLNGVGGGVLFETSDATFRRNWVHDNSADSGAGVCVTEYGTPHIEANLVTDNSALSAGGGMYFGARSSPLVERNRILRNHSGGWGGGGVNSWTSYIFYGTFATMRSNVIAFNSTSAQGGGAYMRYDACRSYNDLYAFNSGPSSGGLFVLNQGASAPRLRGTILWGNGANSIVLESSVSSAIDVARCLVEGGWPGTGNLSSNPLFLDLDGADGLAGTNDDDFRLAAGSPCIDAGASGVSPAGALDANGETRRIDDICVADTGTGGAPVIDMGPFERQSSSCCGDPGNVCSMTPNSVGPGALMGWSGSVSIGANNLVLRAGGCPPLQTGLFFYSFTPQNPPTSFGNGLLCVQAPIVRVGPPLAVGSDGAVARPVDLGAAPMNAGPGQVALGSTIYFQFWYRDPASGGSGFDTSDALEVSFCD